MKKRTMEQHTRLFALLSAAGLKEKEERAALVAQFTNHRTESSKEMYVSECQELIQYLEVKVGPTDQKSGPYKRSREDTMRKGMLNIGYVMDYHLRDTPEVKKREGEIRTKYQSRVNFHHVNNWCKKYGYLHKPLNEYEYEELGALLKQFEAVKKTYEDGLIKE